jgi:hypothetical protein
MPTLAARHFPAGITRLTIGTMGNPPSDRYAAEGRVPCPRLQSRRPVQPQGGANVSVSSDCAARFQPLGDVDAVISCPSIDSHDTPHTLLQQHHLKHQIIFPKAPYATSRAMVCVHYRQGRCHLRSRDAARHATPCPSVVPFRCAKAPLHPIDSPAPSTGPPSPLPPPRET